MAIRIDNRLTPRSLLPALDRLFELAASKIVSIEKSWRPARGTPVFTVKGRYTARGWTEWTQGFQFGSALLQFDATDERRFLELGRRKTVAFMAPHLTHRGVHDHGFNNVSTYGNLLRLLREGRLPWNEFEKDFYELALKVSGAVQAMRWTPLGNTGGFIHSFNGPHSLFIDTIRSLRALALSHRLGHSLRDEQDREVSLLGRLIRHAEATARYAVYYGEGRDTYDVPGRTAHESVFNIVSGQYRCPNSQQGYSPFSTWTRGQAWAICGYAELLEFLPRCADKELKPFAGRRRIRDTWLRAARATADGYINEACADGIPVWDTGAPNLHRMGDYAHRPSDPYNRWEPVDSSAAAIAAQGLWRLGLVLGDQGKRYCQAALTIARSLFQEPYLSTQRHHQGLLLHSVYHRPNGWDHIARGQTVPNGESSMWGDYHALELALLLRRAAKHQPHFTFFGGLPSPRNHG